MVFSYSSAILTAHAADSRKFEKAYCLYRTNDLDGALRVLESIEHGVREKELSAQVVREAVPSRAS